MGLVRLFAVPRRTLGTHAREEDDVVVGRDPSRRTKKWSQRVVGADRAIAVTFAHLGGDPLVIAPAVEHWSRVPEARAELGTHGALTRLTPRGSG